MAAGTASVNMLEKVAGYKARLKDEAEVLVSKNFPGKIIELDELLRSPLFCRPDGDSIATKLNIPVPDPIVLNSHDSPLPKKRKIEANDVTGTAVMILPTGAVPVNHNIMEVIKVLKPIIQKLMEDTNLLKMWISFLIPKIEDGNNFGVSVQEDTLGEIQAVESEAATFFDGISRYYTVRGKLVSKVAKYPHIEDYRQSVRELDEKEYVSLRLVLCEIRNRYSTLHDIITKNLDKIRRPRSIHTETMY